MNKIFKHWVKGSFVLSRPVKDETTDKRWMQEENLFSNLDLTVLIPTSLKEYSDEKDGKFVYTVIYFSPLDTSIKESIGKSNSELEAKKAAWEKLYNKYDILLRTIEQEFANIPE